MAGPTSPPLQTTFLNVDLDLRVEQGLDELLGAMAGSVFVLHKTAELASVELNEPFATPDEAIQRFVAVVHSLPPQARAIWDQGSSRTMNIGIQVGREPYSASFAISSDCIRRLADLGGDLELTIYAPYEPD